MRPEDVVVYDINTFADPVVRVAVHLPTETQAKAFEAVMRCCTAAIFKEHVLLGRFGPFQMLQVSQFQGLVLSPPPPPTAPDETPFTSTSRLVSSLLCFRFSCEIK
jgi:hypothetical protein